MCWWFGGNKGRSSCSSGCPGTLRRQQQLGRGQGRAHSTSATAVARPPPPPPPPPPPRAPCSPRLAVGAGVQQAPDVGDGGAWHLQAKHLRPGGPGAAGGWPRGGWPRGWPCGPRRRAAETSAAAPTGPGREAAGGRGRPLRPAGPSHPARGFDDPAVRGRWRRRRRPECEAAAGRRVHCRGRRSRPAGTVAGAAAAAPLGLHPSPALSGPVVHRLARLHTAAACLPAGSPASPVGGEPHARRPLSLLLLLRPASLVGALPLAAGGTGPAAAAGQVGGCGRRRAQAEGVEAALPGEGGGG